MKCETDSLEGLIAGLQADNLAYKAEIAMLQDTIKNFRVYFMEENDRVVNLMDECYRMEQDSTRLYRAITYYLRGLSTIDHLILAIQQHEKHIGLNTDVWKDDNKNDNKVIS